MFLYLLEVIQTAKIPLNGASTWSKTLMKAFRGLTPKSAIPPADTCLNAKRT